MKFDKAAWLYGVAIWVFPFVVAVFIFPLRESERPLFESIMPVVVTLSVVLASDLYFRKLESEFLKTGIKLGVLWFAVSWAIDTFMFSAGPMAMPLLDYVKDIGLTYLIIPIVTIGYGWLLDQKSHRLEAHT